MWFHFSLSHNKKKTPFSSPVRTFPSFRLFIHCEWNENEDRQRKEHATEMKCIDFQTYFHCACIFKGSGLCSLVVFVLEWFMGLVWPGWSLWKATLCCSSNFHFKGRFYRELREVTRDPWMNRRSARHEESERLRQNSTSGVSETERVSLCC